jgi:hypothetical protein
MRTEPSSPRPSVLAGSASRRVITTREKSPGTTPAPRPTRRNGPADTTRSCARILPAAASPSLGPGAATRHQRPEIWWRQLARRWAWAVTGAAAVFASTGLARLPPAGPAAAAAWQAGQHRRRDAASSTAGVWAVLAGGVASTVAALAVLVAGATGFAGPQSGSALLGVWLIIAVPTLSHKHPVADSMYWSNSWAGGVLIALAAASLAAVALRRSARR